MRRIVRDYLVAALRRQQNDLECFLARHLEVGDPFPLILAEPAVVICEVRGLTIAPRFGSDFPEVDVTAALRVAITATAERRDAARGIRTAAVPETCVGRRTFAIDVELKATGTAVGSGYEVRPLRARLTGWWGWCLDPSVTVV